MDKAILDNTRQNAGLEKIRAGFVKGRPRVDTLRRILRGTAKRTCLRASPPRKRSARTRFGYHYHSETDPAAQARIWSLREAALGLSMATRGDAKSISFVEDHAVAPEKLSAFIGRFLDIIHGHGTTAGIYAHASVGCLTCGLSST